MYHSITFGDKNTWDDWHLVPSTRPAISPPEPKTNFIDIPGANGSLDLTEALIRTPIYNDRSGSIEFIVMNPTIAEAPNCWDDWAEAYATIMDYLHGQRMRMVLEDDPAFFYEGRFMVKEWKTDKSWSNITVDYRVAPYKKFLEDTTKTFIANPFNVPSHYSGSSPFANISVSSTSAWSNRTFRQSDIGRMPVCPEFVVSSNDGNGMQIRLVNSSLGIDTTKSVTDGTSKVPEMVLFCPNATATNTVGFKGNGTVSIKFNGGRL